MYIYNSVSKQKEKFTPIENNNTVRVYVCGPTVYDDAHLGHARSSIAFDLLRRVLKANKYKVIFVKNITDIDDKIIKKSQESGKSIEEITTYYTKRYHDDMEAIGVLKADIEPKATQNIEQMIEYITHLVDSGFAYILTDGIYFDTSRDYEYLSISHQNTDESQNQSRIETNSDKRDPKDFAIWKFVKDDTISYPCLYGKGRPGWHTECSVMIQNHLASFETPYQIDIHGGGADLLFPHHENEASQSRCFSNQELAKYWMHNGFVQIDGTKMSKSLGNSFFLKDALKVYSGEVLRFYLLSTHYRANFNFNEEDLLSSKKRLDKLYRLKKRLNIEKGSTPNKEFKTALMQNLNDDLNISATLAVIDEMTSDANDLLDKEPKNKALKKEIRANLSLIEDILGIGSMDAYKYFQIGISDEEIEEIEKLILKRDEAKKSKDYATSDAIRDELKKKNIMIMDTPNGTAWEKES